MRFADHDVVPQLEALIAEAHSVIYRQKIARRRDWNQFWRFEVPGALREHMRPIALATLIFWIAAGLGAVLTLQAPQLGSFFVSPDMVEGLEHGELWTTNVTSVAPMASSAIAQNNITVALMSWALGVTFGIGTLYMMVVNGLMLGAIFVVCMRYAMAGALAEFVIAHGSLELPAIWIAGGAGFMMAKALLVPGRYSRGVEFRLAARRSMKVLMSTVPMLIVAATVEGFISPSDLPAPVKMAVALTLMAGFVVYMFASPKQERSAQRATT